MSQDAELRAALEKAEQERDEALAKAAELEAKLAKKAKKGDNIGGDKSEPTQIDKSALPAEVREALEKAEAERDELKKAAEQAADLAKAERDLRVTKEFIAKAESEFAHVGGNAEEFGKLLKTAAEALPEDAYQALTERLKAAEEQVTKSLLFKEAGVSGDPVPAVAGTAEADAIQRKAEELRKNDSSLSPYEAMHLAMRMDREAQLRYLQANR